MQRRSCLLVLAHPRLDTSVANKALAAEAADLPDVEIDDLYDRYPDYQIDIAAEQERLEAHDVIGLQFPLFWYSTPALLKEWFDLVWLHGFAYGGSAPRLAGKTLFCATSTGGDAISYTPGGRNGHVMADFLRPLERTAMLCGMRWARPHIVHDIPRLGTLELAAARGSYRGYLQGLLDGRIPA